MSSLYTPVFFPPSHLTQPSSALSSSNPKKAIKAEIHLLSTLHLSLSHLPPTLCPPSPSSSYVSSERVDNIRSAIENTLETCDYDRSSGKWGLVKGHLRLRCSRLGGSGRYKWDVGNALDVERARKAKGKEKEKDKQWMLVDTEEEWFEWERQNQSIPSPETEAQRPPAQLPITQSPMTVTTRVKTWQQNLPFHTCTPLSSPARSQSVPALTPSLPTGSSVQLEEVRKKEKVAVWEGEFVDPIVTPHKAKAKATEKQKRKGAKVEKGKKGKEKEKEHEKESSPLGFPVVKRAGLASKKAGPSPLSSKASSAQVQEQELTVVPHPESESVPESGLSGGKEIVKDKKVYEFGHSVTSIPGLVMGANETVQKKRDQTPLPFDIAKIQDVSEMSFLPPSFPHILRTSTPNPKNPKEKPPQIIPSPSSPVVSAAEIDLEISSAPPPPTSSVPAEVDEVQEVEEIVGIKRSRTREGESMEMDIHESPTRKRVKTGTPVLAPETPKPKDTSASPHRMDISPDRPKSPIHVMDVSPAHSPVPMTKGTHSPRAASPPPQGSVDGEPRPPVVRAGSVFVTPNRQLPTLIELLASDRQKEKGFPKSRMSAKPDSKATAVTPVKDEKQKEPEKEQTPDPSPTKSLFAFTPTPSPSNSLPFRSPLTPSGLPGFTQNPGAFAPSYASGIGGGSYSYKSLGRSSSGFLGFNSQFDVEGQVDRVSELLERDVDFDGWLKSIPGAEGDAGH